MDDKQFLKWLKERLINVHGEDPCYDYMWRLQAIIENTPQRTYSSKVAGLR